MKLVRFGVRNGVPMTLLTWTVVLGGTVSAFTIRREFFPDAASNTLRAELRYPGASPGEIEESLAIKIEDAAGQVDDTDRIVTMTFEGGGSVTVKFQEGADLQQRKEDLRDRIDSLRDLPEEAERTRVVEHEPMIPVIQVTAFGDTDPETLKRCIREIEDDLKTFPGMGRLVVEGSRDYEIRVEVDHAALVRLGIPITAVADSVSAWMRELPGGVVRSPDGQVAVRSMGVEERADRIREIVVAAAPDGQAWRLGDIARVEEGYVDDEFMLRFNGKPSAFVTVYKGPKDDALNIAGFVRGYVAGRQGAPLDLSWWESITGTSRTPGWELGSLRGPLPVSLAANSDLARIIDGRLELLRSNALQGAALVFLTLLLGVNYRAAWWVMAGIVVAILGTLFLMQVLGMSLNLLTMFSLLLVLGMLEDDAIVFAESIESAADRDGLGPEDAAAIGVGRVFWPVVASVCVTVVAFLPLGFVGGQLGDMLEDLPIVVCIALLVSLLEAVVLMPSHIAHGMERIRAGRIYAIDRLLAPWDRIRDNRLWPWLERKYEAIASWCVLHRYVTVSAGLGALIFSLGMVAGGRLSFTFLPSDDTETVIVNLRMPLGTSLERTAAIGARIESAAAEQPETKSITGIYGTQIDLESGAQEAVSGNVAQFFIELHPVEVRERHSNDVVAAIQRRIGRLPEAEDLNFTEMAGGPAGADIAIEVSGDDLEELRHASRTLVDALAAFDGIVDVADDDYAAQPEIHVTLRPEAAALGLTPALVARQIRGAIHGIDAHVHTADREDIDVRVRLDDASRTHLGATESMWVITPSGKAVPLDQVARVRDGAGNAAIRRVDRQRTLTVSADTDSTTAPEDVVAAIAPVIARLSEELPHVTIGLAGRQKDRLEAFATIPWAAGAALVAMYTILAWLFGNYTQPFAVMAAIPFGIIGAIWGHMLLGYSLTFLSLIGLVALSGVVINNSLVMVEFVNREHRGSGSLRAALVMAGKRRLRPILLTSITTVVGLAPLVFEQSFQAKFLIPMAISLCGGLLSATFLTLLLLPAILVIREDVSRVVSRVFGGGGYTGSPSRA
ncbi:MAG: efflux RND transporter permease subunit [Phycisphaerales bacterium]|nr:efflux RND transporter permease subunit [Phycisphaerales bacterium]